MFRLLRDDGRATRQSIFVLTVAGLSFGLGFAVSVGAGTALVLVGGIIGVVVGNVVGFVWLSLTYLVGTRLFRGSSSYWNLARPVFFASSPGPIFLLMLVPASPIPDIVRAVGLAWIAIANVFAIKNAFGFDNQRSLMTFIVVALILVIGYGLLLSL